MSEPDWSEWSEYAVTEEVLTDDFYEEVTARRAPLDAFKAKFRVDGDGRLHVRDSLAEFGSW